MTKLSGRDFELVRKARIDTIAFIVQRLKGKSDREIKLTLRAMEMTVVSSEGSSTREEAEAKLVSTFGIKLK